ncbi:helix-turn-helix transcriptional regulator [Streptomyces huasconensis]|uniref:Helix-turn-helix transcriptional regulator n=2 Tax=Streptomyces huasconensis TaxID=1854574 RepID=A0ABV3LRT7_9ACTN
MSGSCPYRVPGRDPIAETVELGRLTRRERQVLLLLGTGMNNRELARELRIAERTVKAHTARVLEKLSVPSRLDAAVLSVLLHHVLCEDPSCTRRAVTVEASDSHLDDGYADVLGMEADQMAFLEDWALPRC